MAATLLTAINVADSDDEVSLDLTTMATADATNGNVVSNHGGRVRLMITGPSAAADTLSVKRFATVEGEALPDHEFAVPANKTVVIGPFPPQAHSGSLYFTLGDATSKVLALVTEAG